MHDARPMDVTDVHYKFSCMLESPPFLIYPVINDTSTLHLIDKQTITSVKKCWILFVRGFMEALSICLLINKKGKVSVSFIYLPN